MEKSIYHIQNDHLQLMRVIEENEGEITPEIDEQLSLTKDEFEQKAVSYGYLMKHINNESINIKNEIDRLNKILYAKDKLETELKKRVTDAMLNFGINKISLNNLTLSFRKSEVLFVEPETQIPSEYIKTKTTELTDNAKMKADVKAGKVIPGVSILEKQNLQIK